MQYGIDRQEFKAVDIFAVFDLIVFSCQGVRMYSKLMPNFYENKNAFLNSCDDIEKLSDFPEVCITTFSESIIKDFARNNAAKVIGNLYSANGTQAAIIFWEVEKRQKPLKDVGNRVVYQLSSFSMERII